MFCKHFLSKIAIIFGIYKTQIKIYTTRALQVFMDAKCDLLTVAKIINYTRLEKKKVRCQLETTRPRAMG